MLPPDRAGDDDAQLLRRLAATDQPHEACPDANDLAAWVERRLSRRASRTIEGHLADCPPCREVVTPLAAAVSAPTSRLLTRTVLLAAALLLGFGALYLSTLTRPGSLSDRVQIAAAELASAHPQEMAGFELLTGADLHQSPQTLRGGCTLVTPSNTSLEPRPSFAWQGDGTVQKWTVVLRTVAGEELWRETTDRPSLSYPPGKPDLTSGERYLWEIRGAGATGEVRGGKLFAVASAQNVAATARMRSAVDAHRDATAARITLVHWLLRRDLVDAAVEELGRIVGPEQDWYLLEELRGAAARRQGVPEAERDPKSGK